MYETLIRVHIAPVLGHIPLEKLSPLDLQEFYAEKRDAPRADGKPGKLSANTVKHIHDVLPSALKWAVKWQLIARNPAEGVEPPKVEKKEPPVWTAEEAAKFLDIAREHRLYAAFLLAIGAGLRRGEYLASGGGILTLRIELSR